MPTMERQAKRRQRNAVQTRATQTKEEPVMQQSSTPHEMYTQFAGKTVEAITLWAEANQRLMKELADFTAGTAKEGARLYAEIQQNTVKVLGEAPPALPWQPGVWQDGYQKAFKLFEGNIQAMGRSAERVQASAEQAGKGIQEAFSAIGEKMKGL
jgi:hypothetical protein